MTGPGAAALAEAMALHGQARGPEATRAYRAALALEPNLPGAVLGLATLLLEAEGQAEAEPLLAALVRQWPQAGFPRCLLGQALLRLGRASEAESHFRRALRADPSLVAGHHHLAQCLLDRDEPEPALDHCLQAQTLDPESVPVQLGLAEALAALGRRPEAEACLDQLLANHPDHAGARYNRAHLLLLQGRLESGWAGRELRWQVTGTAPRAFPAPRWDGSALAGRTILLHSSQEGFGDAIMALRFARPLQAQGARVLVQCQPSLVAVLRTCPWVDQVLAEGDPLPEFHCQAPLMSLPWHLRAGLADLACPSPYLTAPDRPGPGPGRQEQLRQRLQGTARLKIGLVHAGNPSHPNDLRRSISPASWAALAALRPEVAFFSLQQHRQPALEPLPEALAAVDLGDLLEDFSDTAWALAHLDLLISVDTAVAHLAGAMAKPVRLLLPHIPEWRWFLDRADSPWYPSFQLVRQAQPGDWDSVLAQVVAELLAEVRP